MKPIPRFNSELHEHNQKIGCLQAFLATPSVAGKSSLFRRGTNGRWASHHKSDHGQTKPAARYTHIEKSAPQELQGAILHAQSSSVPGRACTRAVFVSVLIVVLGRASCA